MIRPVSGHGYRPDIDLSEPRTTQTLLSAAFTSTSGERGTYCLGVHFTVGADLDVPRSVIILKAF